MKSDLVSPLQKGNHDSTGSYYLRKKNTKGKKDKKNIINTFTCTEHDKLSTCFISERPWAIKVARQAT